MKLKRMEASSVICANCSYRMLVSPFYSNYRCNLCAAEIINPKCEIVPKGVWWFHRKTRSQNQRNPDVASPMPVKKPNPMNNTSWHQPKKAVLCGVSYQTRKHKLKGTVNDVKRMKSLLLEQFHFPEDAICVLTEDQNYPDLTPTKANMQKALQWLVAGCKSGDSLVFYFSGHGLRQPDFNGDERDGYDETLCPTDFMTAGMIIDNDINNIIVKPLKEGVKLHAIIDACHSGTILDLEHVYNRKKNQWLDNSPPSGVSKSTSGGHAISLSACADDQMAADTSAFLGNEMIGALTYIFVEAMKTNSHITYGKLLDLMHQKIEEANKTRCPSFVQKLFRNKIIQDPQLSSSKVFNVDKEKFKF